MKSYAQISFAEYQHALNQAVADEQLNLDIEAAAHSLRTLGYGVVPNVLPPEECDAIHNQFWEVMTGASGGRITRPQSAEDLAGFKATGNWPLHKHGIFEDGAWAHMPFAYAVRTHPRVVRVFARLYGFGRHLIASSDRINYQFPAEWLPSTRLSTVPADPANIGCVSEAKWLHFDQALNKHGLYCVQGLVTMTDATHAGDASLELIPGTHLHHDKLAQQLQVTDKAKLRTDWYKFSDDEKLQLNTTTTHFSSFQSIRAAKGSLLLWDSRTWHQGGRIRAHSECPRPQPTPRFVVYVCMQPALRGELPAIQMTKRKQLFQEHRAMAHWPLKTKMFPKVPYNHGQPLPAFNFDAFFWTPEQLEAAPVMRALFGLEPMRIGCPIDALPDDKPALLDFAPESGVSKSHPPKKLTQRARSTKRKPVVTAISSAKKPRLLE